MWPGLLATLVSTLVLALWVHPLRSALPSTTISNAAGLAAFCLLGSLVIVALERHRRVRDLAASQRRMRSLRESEDRFTTIFHSSPISMSIIRVSNGECYDVNQAHVELFGYTREETVGHTGRELNMWVSTSDRERVLESLSRSQRLQGYEADLRRKDGGVITALLSAEVIRLGGDQFIWMLHNDITERKRAEETFRRVVEAAPVGLVIVNRAGQIVLVNAETEHQFGYPRAELVGRPIETLIPERFRPRHEQDRSSFSSDPAPRAMGKGRDLFGQRRDGSEFPVEIGLTPIEMAGVKHVMASVIDITERKEAEIALRTLVDAIPGMVLLLDRQGMVLAANETIAQRLGMRAQEMVGGNAYDHLPPALAAARKAYADRSIRTGDPCQYEDSREGRRFENFVYPIKDGVGKVTRLAVLSMDVTERKRAEDILKEQAMLLDIASDAILVKDLESRIRYWNKGAQRLYGWTAEEAAGRSAIDFLYPQENVEEGRNAREGVVARGEWTGDLHQRTKAGRTLIVEARWTLIRGDDGAPTGILSVASDVTAKRSTEAQLLRAQRLESLGTLAGGIAHDLNNVLAPVLMGVEGLVYRELDDSTRKLLGIIKASAQRGVNIVRQILNFARGQEGQLGELQLRHVFREIEEIIRETFPRSIEVRVNMPRDLWPVVGNATHLHQVLMNLCVNARDAMPAGGLLTVSVSNEHLGEDYIKTHIDARPVRYVRITVEDTGTGIEPALMDRIFDPFFTTKDPGKGTGLGLSTVRTIVKNHGGFLTFYSEPGSGTSFQVYIPATEERAESTVQGPERLPRGRGELVLIVDDEAPILEITGQILESFGYRVIAAADGAAAVSRYAENRAEVRLVITDMMMPHVDGAATIRAIRDIDPGARFIATSGLVESESAREARALGVDGFLAKPCSTETLLETVAEVLKGGAAPPAR